MISLFTALLMGLDTEHYKALQHKLCLQKPTSLEGLAALCDEAKQGWDGRYTQHLPRWEGKALVFEVDYDKSPQEVGNLKVELLPDHLRISEQDTFRIFRTSSEVLNFLEY